MSGNSGDSSRDRGKPVEFATTHWTMVCRAGVADSETSREALHELCQNYWYPLYSYARRRVRNREHAEDLIQSFFATLLEKNYVAIADASRGRFRAFLITSLKNHMANEWGKKRAQKRGGDRIMLSLDFERGNSNYSIEPVTDVTPEQLFDRNWAVTLLTRVLEKLETDQSAAGRAEQFRALKPYLIGQPDASYAEVAKQLNMTEAAAKMAVTRLKKKYRETLRTEIAQTVLNDEQVEQEIRDLFRATS